MYQTHSAHTKTYLLLWQILTNLPWWKSKDSPNNTDTNTNDCPDHTLVPVNQATPQIQKSKIPVPTLQRKHISDVTPTPQLLNTPTIIPQTQQQDIQQDTQQEIRYHTKTTTPPYTKIIPQTYQQDVKLETQQEIIPETQLQQKTQPNSQDDIPILPRNQIYIQQETPKITQPSTSSAPPIA